MHTTSFWIITGKLLTSLPYHLSDSPSSSTVRVPDNSFSLQSLCAYHWGDSLALGNIDECTKLRHNAPRAQAMTFLKYGGRLIAGEWGLEDISISPTNASLESESIRQIIVIVYSSSSYQQPPGIHPRPHWVFQIQTAPSPYLPNATNPYFVDKIVDMPLR